MRNDDTVRAVEHRADYETFENRLVLSAQPWNALALEPWATDAAPAQIGTESPQADYARELTEDLAYIKERYGLTGRGQTVAVIDSGIAYDHVALGAGFGPDYRVVGGWDFTEENDADPYDDGPAGFHGTHIAGILGSDDSQYPGVAPEVDFVALRVFNDQGVGRFAWLEQALQWVHENRDAFEYPITTVNLSLGTNLQGDNTAPWEMLEDEFAQLKADGMFIAVAAGNAFADTGPGALTYPASSQYVVPVGSLGEDGGLSDFSQRDPRILAAPGERVISTVPGHLFGGTSTNDFAYAHGTSMATPYVAGGSILVREAMQRAGYDEITQDAIESHLRATADTVYDPATDQSYLSLNLRRAIDALLASGAAGAGEHDASVSLVGTTVRVRGTAAEDAFEFYAGLTHRMVVNGMAYEFPSAEIEAVEFLGGGGGDRLLVVGGSDGETVRIGPESAEWIGTGIAVRADAMAAITVRGGGGFDQAYLYDSAGDDTFRAYDDRAQLVSDQFEVSVEGFDRVSAFSERGGNDRAYLYDSPGNDRFYGRPSYASIAGMGFGNRAEGFERVYAYAQNGGQDVASFYDSSGNDRFYGRPEYASMSGMGYYNRAEGFERVYAYATIGGNDRAELYDTRGDDRFYGRTTYASLTGRGMATHVRGFDRVSAYSVAGGEDRAYFYDSAGNDRFRADPTYASMSGLGFYNTARGFERVYAYASGGYDTAELTGSFQDDALVSTGNAATLSGAAFQTTASGFESLSARGGGGMDEAVLRDVDPGDTFYGRSVRGVLESEGALRRLDDFDRITLEGETIEADIAALEYVFRQIGQRA